MKKYLFLLILALGCFMACDHLAMVDPTVAFPEAPGVNTGGDNGGIISPVGSLITMKDVHGGTFSMGILAGSLPEDAQKYHVGDEAPVRTVTVSDFIMGETEVTQAQWHAVMGAEKMPNSDGSTVPSFNTGKGDNYPVYNISWYDAIRFCNGLSAREGLEAVYTLADGTALTATTTRTAIEAAGITYDNSKNGYRLPTEAEWEYAAGGGATGTARTIFSGTSSTSKTDIAEYAWFHSGETAPTSTDIVKGTTPRKPNRLGLYDMSGNVAEWCWDEYATYAGDNLPNPAHGTYTGGTESKRVYRGGWYNEGWDESLIHMRYSEVTRVRTSYLSRIGFRVVRTLEIEGSDNTGGNNVITMADIALTAVNTSIATSGVKMPSITIPANFADTTIAIEANTFAFHADDNTAAEQSVALRNQVTTSFNSATKPTGVVLDTVTIATVNKSTAKITIKVKADTGYAFASGFDTEVVITLQGTADLFDEQTEITMADIMLAAVNTPVATSGVKMPSITIPASFVDTTISLNAGDIAFDSSDDTQSEQLTALVAQVATSITNATKPAGVELDGAVVVAIANSKSATITIKIKAADGYKFADAFTDRDIVVTLNSTTDIFATSGGNNGGTDPVASIITVKQVAGGSFKRANDGTSDPATASATHTVTVDSFYMGETEVTQAQWKAVMSEGVNDGNFDGTWEDNVAMYHVTWDDAIRFCNVLSIKENLEPVYTLADGTALMATTTRKSIEETGVLFDHSKNGYRLPTEAEWEYAAGGGSGTRTDLAGVLSTASDVNDYVIYTDNSGGKVNTVKTKKANQLKLYDMSGNVAEWCWDGRADYGTEDVNNPTGENPKGYDTDDSVGRVVRGGDFENSLETSRVYERRSYRNRGTGTSLDFNGFRVVRAKDSKWVDGEGEGSTGGETNNVTVTFKANGGTGSDATQTIESNKATALTANTFTRSGYTFKGWTSTEGSTVISYTDSAEITITVNTTLYAVWEQNVTEISMAAITLDATTATTAGTTVKMPAITIPSSFADTTIAIDATNFGFHSSDDTVEKKTAALTAQVASSLSAVAKPTGVESLSSTVTITGSTTAEITIKATATTGYVFDAASKVTEKTAKVTLNATTDIFGELKGITMGAITLNATTATEAGTKVKMPAITIGETFADVPLTISAGEIAFADADNTFVQKKTALEAQITTSLSGTLPTGVELVSVTASVSTADTATVTVTINAKTGYKFADSFTDRETVITLNTKGDFSMLHALPVTGGSFSMGIDSTPEDMQDSYLNGDEKPVQSVTVNDFYMGETEVTQKQWYEVMTDVTDNGAPIDKSTLDKGQGDDFPMYMVTWHHALRFCNQLSINEGLDPVYTFTTSNSTLNKNSGRSAIEAGVQADFTKNGYRLPTEAEWEFAAGGGAIGAERTHFAGTSTVGQQSKYAVYGSSEDNSTTVKSKLANKLGLYDMSGNILEWCWDEYATYPLENTPDTETSTYVHGTTEVVARGGWYSDGWDECLIYTRQKYSPRGGNTPNKYLGFRVVRSAVE